MYTLRSSEQVDDQIAHLRREALAAFAEVRALLEVAPWSGGPLNRSVPDAPVRFSVFGPEGRGAIYYLIQERDRLVDLLDVLWVE